MTTFRRPSRFLRISQFGRDRFGSCDQTKLNRIFRRRMTIAEVSLEDENQTPLKAVWFNQPFILESMPLAQRFGFPEN